MSNTFNQMDFDAAIVSKDYIKLKNYIINSIRNNPRFRHEKNEEFSEATTAFKKLLSMKEELPGLFTKYELQSGEVEFNEDEQENRKQEYFIRQTFLLGENFCQKRFNNVRKIGQYLAKGNFDDPQELIEGCENVASSSVSADMPKSAESMPWLLIVVLVIAIIVLLVGKMAEIKWLFITGVILAFIAAALVIFILIKRG